MPCELWDFSEWLVETGTISGLYGCQVLFPVILQGESLLPQVFSSRTRAHQSSAKYLSGPSADLCLALSSASSPSWSPAALVSPDSQCHLFNPRVHWALSGFPFPAPQPGNSSQAVNRVNYLFPISQRSLSLTAWCPVSWKPFPYVLSIFLLVPLGG